ncbi:MAG: hypothetical protein JO202_02630 [Ktedonobacteraceae bacterium]|nr:hypothetical protein [Ktedonobacteraceae bacterium]
MGLSRPKRQYNDFNSTRKGDISESVIISKLLECGYDLLRPIGNNSRYDLATEDENGQFLRVQCKRRVYLVPVDHTGTSSTVLGVTATKNNQEKNVRWARDYEL